LIKEFAAIDIETIPHPALPEGSRPAFDESTVQLGNRKDPVKIHECIESARAKFEIDIDKKMATHPDLCMIVCIALTWFDGDRGESIICRCAKDERDEYILIGQTWHALLRFYQQQIPIVSYNGLTFDLPVLIRRAMYSDVSVAPLMIANLTRRQDANRHHYDLAAMLGLRSPFSGAVEVKSLPYYLKRFGLGAKTNGMNGAMVYPLWKEGRFEEIEKYCTGDVDQTAALFRRVAPWLVAPKEPTVVDPIHQARKENKNE
jgi:predicted PolB exonuclease-like 3'-5' exonuclease